MTRDHEALADEKVCSRCKLSLPLDSFYRWKNKGKVRPSDKCKECQRSIYQSPEYRSKKAASSAVRRTLGLFKESERRHARKREAEQPEKSLAKRAVRAAVGRGELVRAAACEACGQTPVPLRDGRPAIQAHHDDYSRPLDICWLCVACHVAHHAQEKVA